MKGGLTVKNKLAYGSGDFGLAFTSSMLSLLFAIFLTDVVGLRPGLAALCVFVGRTWDYINDPIMGFITDRTRSRWGRHRPYLLFGAIPFGIAFALMWWIPPLGSQLALAIYYSAAYFLFDTMVTLVFIPYIALTPQITQDYDERTSLTSFRMVFSLIGSMVAFVLPLAYIGKMNPGNINKIYIISLAMAVVCSIPFLITFAGTREDMSAVENQPKAPLRESIKAAAINRPFLLAVVIYLATISGFEVTQSMIMYFFKYSIRIEEGADKLFALMFIVSLLAIPFWNFLSRKYNKARSYIIAMIGMIVLRIILALMVPETPLAAIVTLTILTGVCLSAGQILPWAIVPDTVEYDEYLTGRRHEGVFYSFMTLARKIASSLTLPAVLLLLDVSGYVANAPEQGSGAALMIRFLFGGVPIILFICGILAAVFYPLTRERFDEIRRELSARKGAGG
jgi:GPH family glycoside/pentoside/hexuronide:cation symporter